MQCTLLPLVLLLGACAAPLEPAEVPHFAPDDERVQTAGFVRETLRLAREVEDTTYTFMAFRVGDKVTFGAMLAGPFDGQVEWRIGPHVVWLPFPDQAPEHAVPAELQNPPPGAGEILGQRASFGGTSWITIELERELWLPTQETPVSLVFHSTAGDVVRLPADGPAYAVSFAPR